jgi:hypothetical protein
VYTLAVNNEQAVIASLGATRNFFAEGGHLVIFD